MSQSNLSVVSEESTFAPEYSTFALSNSGTLPTVTISTPFSIQHKPSLTYLVTGGTGSFGSALIRHLLHSTDHKVRILSRDEQKQDKMASVIPPSDRVTYVLADIRDAERLSLAFHKADVVVHAAANKIVSQGERHVEEFVKTNILGSINVVKASIANRVSKTLLISSDKSVSALNAYGRTKSMAESIFTAANIYGHGCRFSSVRGGNVFGSRGSVMERWLSLNPIPVTDPDITRFHLLMPYWLDFCLQATDNMHGGEVFIPKCRAWRLGDLAEAFCKVYTDKTTEITGHRNQDKAHESLISHYESTHAVDIGWAYIVPPPVEISSVWNYVPHIGAKVRKEVVSNEVKMIGVEELERLIRENM